MIEPGSIVLVHLTNPVEKFWGVLRRLDPAGVVLRGINLSSFEDWLRQIATQGEPSLDLATMFVPLPRVERIFLDEQVGEVQSYSQRFAHRVGRTVESYLGLSNLGESRPS